MALKNLLPVKTTAQVLDAFHKTVRQLADVRDQHAARADQHEEEASDLISKANAHRRESNAARQALERFEAILGVTS